MDSGRSADPQATSDRGPTPQGIERSGALCFVVCGGVGSGPGALVERLRAEAQKATGTPSASPYPDQGWRGAAGMTSEPVLAEQLAAGPEAALVGNVTFHSFSTPRRVFIVADLAAQEAHTHEMIAAAAAAELAVIRVDAGEGVLTQTRRDSLLVHLLGVAGVVLAVDGMDRIGWDRARFERIDVEYRELAATLGIREVITIPVSSPTGDNIAMPGPTMPWYTGPTLMQILEGCELGNRRREERPLRLRVRGVHRPRPDVRACEGWISGGRLRAGDALCVQPSGRRTRVARIVGAEGELAEAVAGQSVSLTFTDDADIAPGDLLSASDAPAEVADRFEADLLWLADEPLLPGRPYWLQRGAAQVGATVMALKHRIDVDTLRPVPATRLRADEIAVGTLALDRPIPFDAYRANHDTGGFVLVDRQSSQTVGVGLLHFALRRAHNIHPQTLDIDKAARARLLGQRPLVVWLTGLSGAGKSTIANALERRLHAMGRATYLLDGDNVRGGLNRDLGFTDADRVENIRRVAEVARLMVDAGLIVVTAFISPFRSEREMARRLFQAGEFMEVYVDAPLEVAERRDPKGLYAKARRGELPHFTGIDSPYEAPETPELHLSTAAASVEACVDRILSLIDEGP